VQARRELLAKLDKRLFVRTEATGQRVLSEDKTKSQAELRTGAEPTPKYFAILIVLFAMVGSGALFQRRQ